MAQALMEESAATDIGLCAIGELPDDIIGGIVTPGEAEFFVGAMVGGAILPEQIGMQAFDDDLLRAADEQAAASTRDKRGAWREYLQMLLPRYMVPADFLVLDTLPLTQNGKIDRSALRQLAETSLRKNEQIVPPASDLEHSVADIWRTVLSLEAVDIDTNFFELGGTSIGIVRVHRALVDKLGTPMPLTKLFQFPTIRTLAGAIAGQPLAAIAHTGVDRVSRRQSLLAQRRERASHPGPLV